MFLNYLKSNCHRNLLAIASGILLLLLHTKVTRAADHELLADQLLMKKKYEQATEHYQKAIQGSPTLHAYYNGGLAAFLSGKYKLSKQWWELLAKHAPNDLRLLSKLVQVHEKLDDIKSVEKYIALIKRVHAANAEPAEKAMASFCRDQFVIGDSKFFAYQFYNFPKDSGKKFLIAEYDSQDNCIRKMVFGSNPRTNQLSRELGRLKKGERLYQVEFFVPTGHQTYLHTKMDMTYRDFKTKVLNILKDNLQPIATSRAIGKSN